MKVSVIIPTYYHEAYIGKAIDSVLAQKGNFNIEIIVSDDASKDNTVNIVQDYVNRYPNSVFLIRYYNNIGTTRNIYNAFLKATGEYICILAGDDCFCDEKKIEKQANFLDANPNCFAVATAVQSVYIDGELISISPEKQYLGAYFKREDFARGINYPNHGIMFRNNFHENSVKEAFHIMVEYSKYVDDLTCCLLYFEFGDVFILPDVTYSVTTRRETDTNQHNYNSVTKKMDMLAEHIVLLDRLRIYFDGRVDVVGREQPMAWGLFREIMKTKQLSYLKYLSHTPKRLLLIGFLMSVKKHLHKQK